MPYLFLWQLCQIKNLVMVTMQVWTWGVINICPAVITGLNAVPGIVVLQDTVYCYSKEQCQQPQKLCVCEADGKWARGSTITLPINRGVKWRTLMLWLPEPKFVRTPLYCWYLREEKVSTYACGDSGILVIHPGARALVQVANAGPPPEKGGSCLMLANV